MKINYQHPESAVWHLANRRPSSFRMGAPVKWFDMNLCIISDKNHLL